jgi:hypothetical protein
VVVWYSFPILVYCTKENLATPNFLPPILTPSSTGNISFPIQPAKTNQLIRKTSVSVAVTCSGGNMDFWRILSRFSTSFHLHGWDGALRFFVEIQNVKVQIVNVPNGKILTVSTFFPCPNTPCRSKVPTEVVW